ncbi:hypothetical protein T484DRAFT_1930917 [Baffinella frigidus]|nr:hypothetical protein T484DRAFT_1930917 [Cryptophyta sp. CCMP2293]
MACVPPPPRYVLFLTSNLPLAGGECLSLQGKINRALAKLSQASAAELGEDFEADASRQPHLVREVSQAVMGDDGGSSFGLGSQGRQAAWQRMGSARLVKLAFSSKPSFMCVRRWTGCGKLNTLLFRHSTPLTFQLAGVDYQVGKRPIRSTEVAFLAPGYRKGDMLEASKVSTEALLDMPAARARREEYERWGRWVEAGRSVLHSHEDAIAVNSVARFASATRPGAGVHKA